MYGPKIVGRLGIQNLWHQQYIKQIHYILGEIHWDPIAKKQIVSSLEELILESGLENKTWEWPMEKVKKYTTKSWWLSLLEYMNQNQFRLINNTKDAQSVSTSDI